MRNRAHPSQAEVVRANAIGTSDLSIFHEPHHSPRSTPPLTNLSSHYLNPVAVTKLPLSPPPHLTLVSHSSDPAAVTKLPLSPPPHLTLVSRSSDPVAVMEPPPINSSAESPAAQRVGASKSSPSGWAGTLLSKMPWGSGDSKLEGRTLDLSDGVSSSRGLVLTHYESVE